VKKLIFTNNLKWPEVAQDSNHYSFINNILYSTIKYFPSEHLPVVVFLWVYSKCEIKKMLLYFQKKILRDGVNVNSKLQQDVSRFVLWFKLCPSIVVPGDNQLLCHSMCSGTVQIQIGLCMSTFIVIVFYATGANCWMFFNMCDMKSGLQKMVKLHSVILQLFQDNWHCQTFLYFKLELSCVLLWRLICFTRRRTCVHQKECIQE
jgi:hypothetical protein